MLNVMIAASMALKLSDLRTALLISNAPTSKAKKPIPAISKIAEANSMEANGLNSATALSRKSSMVWLCARLLTLLQDEFYRLRNPGTNRIGFEVLDRAPQRRAQPCAVFRAAPQP